MIHDRRTPPPRRTLADIFNEDDDLGLLDVTPASRTTAGSEDQRLVATLQAITGHVERHGEAPSQDDDELAVASLGRSLAAFRRSAATCAMLAPHDHLGLLQQAKPSAADASNNAAPQDTPAPQADPDAAATLDDILASDDLGLLDDDESAASIFDLTHVPAAGERDMPDDIAQRTRCDDFFRFEGLFEQVRDEIRIGEAEVLRFQKESQIDKGDLFVVNGMLCLVDSVGEDEGDKGRYNPRLRVVFDNGTESNLLLRSLARALYKDDVGRRILRRDSTFDAMQGISHHDKRTGVIYILRSQSTDPALQGIRHLHKIGYTEKSLNARLAGAEKQQTYLEAPVKVAASFDCYNLDPRRFEHLVHAMLHHQRVNVALRDHRGNTYRPQEWFDVELDTARDVVKRIVDGTITQYRLDNTTGRLVGKTQ